MGKIKLDGYICERCMHKWLARNKNIPVVCPKCKSAYWNKPRKTKKRRTK